MLGGFWVTVGVVAFKSFRHVVHTVVQGTKLGGEIEEQSWRQSWGCKSDTRVRFPSQLLKSDQLGVSNLIKVGTKVDRQVGPKLGYCETP